MYYRRIKPEQLQVAAAYQRTIKNKTVSDIVRNFNQEAFGVFVVGKRKNGSYWLVDGQTRREAAIKLCLRDVPCLVFDSTGKQHEASVFRLVNTQRSVSKIDRLRAQVCEGDPNSLDMIAIVERCGFKIGFCGARTWPHIRSISPLESAYSDGILTGILQVVNNVWSTSEDMLALQVPILGGIGKFLKTHGDIVSVNDLSGKLKRFACATLVGQCEARKMQGGGRESAMYSVLVDIWNKGRKNKIQLGMHETETTIQDNPE